MIACHAGPFKAEPILRRKVKLRSPQGVVRPARVRAPRPAAAMSIQHWVNKSRRRRSTTSAKAPAASERRNTGKLAEVSTRETSSGEVESEVMSQSAPTSCIQVPMLEASAASHSARKSGCRKGSQPEGKRSCHLVVSSRFPIGPYLNELRQVLVLLRPPRLRARMPPGPFCARVHKVPAICQRPSDPCMRFSNP